ncbi:hypothetical protein B0H12DRAFT_1136098 [Mycena haematopus]|nr:hypothetical protein B0H12DRAFT_1136098 [Mycena haematopus]
MKFFAALFALMAVASVTAAPAHLPANGAKGAVAKASKGKASSKNSSSNNSAAAAAAAAAAASNSSSSADSSDNSTASSDSSDNSTASATSTAASATRTRPCDQGDQSLAAGLSAAVVIGIGQQASVLTLQNSTADADFATAQQRLQQFTDTQALQLQMAQGIADDDSFAQTQLKLLAASQTVQEGLVKGLVGGDVTSSADTLNQLLQSFLDSTNNAQDGAEQALIDCFLPLTAVSG